MLIAYNTTLSLITKTNQGLDAFRIQTPLSIYRVNSGFFILSFVFKFKQMKQLESIREDHVSYRPLLPTRPDR
jgi:hypothetical protein